MARSPQEMAETLIKIYKKTKKRYYLKKDEFKSIAGKEVLKEAYLFGVDEILREDGYVAIDLRNEKDSIAVIKIKTIVKKWEQISQDILNEFEFDDWDEED